MELSTEYLGLKLSHPLMAGASPLADDLDSVRRLADAGSSAIVLRSIFREQFSEGAADLPHFAFGPDEYLAHISRIKRAVDLPVIGSLNGVGTGRWLEYARLIQEAGADALELNLYSLGMDPTRSAEAVERDAIEHVRAVKAIVRIPVAVKLSPFYTSLGHFAGRLDAEGVAGMVLFNRFYQPDVDVEEREEVCTLRASYSGELHLRLRWLAALCGRVRADLAATGGVHTGLDALKAVMCGASAVQMVSALMRRDVGHMTVVREEMARWMHSRGYESFRQIRGSLGLRGVGDPAAHERANYVAILQGWRKGDPYRVASIQ